MPGCSGRCAAIHCPGSPVSSRSRPATTGWSGWTSAYGSRRISEEGSDEVLEERHDPVEDPPDTAQNGLDKVRCRCRLRNDVEDQEDHHERQRQLLRHVRLLARSVQRRKRRATLHASCVDILLVVILGEEYEPVEVMTCPREW